jgi:hypothetical protein
MSDKWTTYFASEQKAYIEPPESINKKHDDLLLLITGNMDHSGKMDAAKELCEIFNKAEKIEQLKTQLKEQINLAAKMMIERDELSRKMERQHAISSAIAAECERLEASNRAMVEGLKEVEDAQYWRDSNKFNISTIATKALQSAPVARVARYQAMQKDAERYQFIRDVDSWGEDYGAWGELGGFTNEEFDRIVDARMQRIIAEEGGE